MNPPAGFHVQARSAIEPPSLVAVWMIESLSTASHAPRLSELPTPDTKLGICAGPRSFQAMIHVDVLPMLGPKLAKIVPSGPTSISLT